MKKLGKTKFNLQKLNTKNRAVSEIIVTVLLVAITLVGGVMVWAIFSGSGNITDTADLIDESKSGELKIIGFDTRDGKNLSQITGLDNTSDSKLCTVSCVGVDTELIVINIRNVSLELVPFESITINEIQHNWDSSTGGVTLSSSSSTWPTEGKFSIIDPTNSGSLTQYTDTSLSENQDIRIVVRLSGNISSDIKLNQEIRIGLSALEADAPVESIAAGTSR